MESLCRKTQVMVGSNDTSWTKNIDNATLELYDRADQLLERLGHPINLLEEVHV